MKPAIDWLEYQRLEQIIPASIQSQQRRSLLSSIAEVWIALRHQLIAPAELQVWQTCDKAGNHWWSAYDPVTGRSVKHVSEAQIRVWIEQRYR